MDSTVDSLNTSYQEFRSAAAGVLEAKELSSGQKTAATDTALENLKQKFELFRVACDQAEELIESIKQRISSECLVDEATGSVIPPRPNNNGGPTPTTSLPPISAVRLEQMSKAVRWLVIELQQGSGVGVGVGVGAPGSNAHGSAPYTRFSEDPAQ